MELIGEFLKKDTDIDIWFIKQKILSLLSKKLGGNSDPIHIIDGFPIPVCLFTRARQCKRRQSMGIVQQKSKHIMVSKGWLLLILMVLLMNILLCLRIRMSESDYKK